MDILSTKQKAFTEASPEFQKDRSVTLGGYSIDFGELISKAGENLGKDTNSLASNSSIAKVAERVEQPAPTEKHEYDYNDDAPKAERYDKNDNGQAQSAEHSDDHSENSNDFSQHGDDAPQDNNENQDASAGNSDSDANSGETQDNDDSNAGQDQSSNDEAPNQQNDANGQANAQNNEQGAAGEQNSQDVLTSLLASAQDSAATSNTSGQAAGNGAENSQNNVATVSLSQNNNASEGRSQNENAAEGLSKAIAAASKQNTGKAENVDANANNQKSLADTHGKVQEQQLVQEKLPTQAKTESGANTANAASQQAAGLAKLAGEGTRMNVNVTTTGDNANVTSQPNSNLSASTVLPSDSSAQQQKGQQPSLNHGAANPNQAVAGPPAQNQTPQVSPQVAATTGADAKGPIQGVQATNTATQTASADASLTTGTNASSETSQTLKNAATHANNANQSHLAKQPVIDQVTVQINKAIKAGMDKINIQLRPENLGRVEVRLEISQEGRTQAVIIADNKEALELLQRDSKELVRSLQDAGLDLGNEDLNFGLREKNEDGDGKDGSAAAPLEDELDAEEAFSDDLLAGSYNKEIIEDDRIDIRA